MWIATGVIALAFIPTFKFPFLPFAVHMSTTVAAIGFVYLYMRGTSIRLGGLKWIFLGFIAVQVVSIIWFFAFGPDIPAILDASLNLSRWRFTWQIAAWILMFSVFVVIVTVVRSERDLRFAVRLLIWFGVVAVGYGAYELTARHFGLPYLYLSIEDWRYKPTAVILIGDFWWARPYGTAGEPKELGQMLLGPLFVALGLAFTTGKIHWHLLSVLFVVGLLATASTSAFLGGVVGSVVWMVLMITSRSLVKKRLFIGLFVGLLVLFLAASSFGSPQVRSVVGFHQLRTTNFAQDDVLITNAIAVSPAYFAGWELGWRLFKTSPVIGVGTGNSPLLSGVTDRLVTPNNLFLMLLAEIGIVGLVVFLAVILYPAWKLVLPLVSGKYRGVSVEIRGVLIGLAAAWFGVLTTYNATGTGRLTPMSWVILGLLASAVLMLLRRSDENLTDGE